jgi:hypothetical protein
MTSKISSFLNHKKNFKSCLNVCSRQKSSRKKTNITFLKHFLNAMIKNIKIHNILDIIEISNSIEPSKHIH